MQFNQPCSIYPYGFLAAKDEAHDDLTGDKLIDRLYEDYASLNTSIDLADIQAYTLEYALRKIEPFGSIVDLLYFNLEKANLTELSRIFILDTLRYIHTGKRDISMIAWEALLKRAHDNNEYVSGSTPPLAAISNQDQDNKSLLHKWVTYRDGFNDLITTLKIMFGTPVV